MPMGCRTSCKIFEEFSTVIEWIAQNDFLFIGNSKESALSKFKKFLDACTYIGIPLEADKTVLPTQVIEFVGITIDVRQKETRLPGDKVEKCRNLLNPYQNKKACTLKEVQSLVGVVNFASSVILPGRAILKRFIQLTMHVSENQKFVLINKECKDDMGMWLVFLDEKFISSNTLHLFTDAAQSKGFAGIYWRQNFFGSFPEV